MQDKLQYKTMLRLLSLLDILAKNHDGVTTREIADIMGLSNIADVGRTLLPALDSALGLPWHYKEDDRNTGKSKHIVIDKAIKIENISIPDRTQMVLSPILEPKELILLGFLLNNGSNLSQIGIFQETINSLRLKLADIFQAASLKENEHEFARLFELAPVFEFLSKGVSKYANDIWEMTLEPLISASMKKKVCFITYNSFNSGGVKDYSICPIRIVENQDGLYLLGLSRKHENRLLLFEIGRFKSVLVTDESFTIPEGIDVDAILASSFGLYLDDPQDYEIRFNAETAKYIREKNWAADQEILEQDDGGLILKMHVGGYYPVKHWIQSWGSGASVIKPDRLKDEIVQEYRKALKQYGTSTEN